MNRWIIHHGGNFRCLSGGTLRRISLVIFDRISVVIFEQIPRGIIERISGGILGIKSWRNSLIFFYILGIIAREDMERIARGIFR